MRESAPNDKPITVVFNAIRPGRASVGQGEKALLVLVTPCFVVVSPPPPHARKKSLGWVILACYMLAAAASFILVDAAHL